MRLATLSDHLDGDKPTGIDRASELGFDGLELVVPDRVHDVGPRGMSLVRDHPPVEADPVWSADERANLRAQATERGIDLPSICPSFMNMRPGLISSDPDERVAATTSLHKLIDAVADIGATTILVPFFVDAEMTSDEEAIRVGDALAAVAPAAADVGVTLAIETTLDATSTRDVVERADHPAIGVYYDVGNATAYGYDPAAELRELGELVSQIHFKDGTDNVADAMLGEGRVDFEGVASALQDIGYDDWIVLETAYDEDPMTAMAQNLAFTRNLLGLHG